MNKFFIVTILLVSVSLHGCTQEMSAPDTTATFFNKSPQQTSDRLFITELQDLQTAYLDSMEIFGVSGIQSNADFLILGDSRQKTIHRILTSDLTLYDSFQLNEGNGPGEIMALNDFDSTAEQIAIYDGRSRKVLISGLDGTLRNEFRLNDQFPHRLTLLTDGRLLIFSTIVISNPFLFTEMDLDGQPYSSFLEVPNPEEHNSIEFVGYLSADNHNHIYYAGYPESILKKYDRDGTLIFSRTTIDNFSSEKNYMTLRADEGMIARGYTDDALFAFVDIDVWDDYLITVPHHNGDADYKYIDIYSAQSGDYLGTLNTWGFPNKITADDDFIYVFESRSGTRTLKKYPNNLHEWFSGQ
ncbi:MAG: 6-bladed beta-propeller [Balneolaceae bacterium]